MQKKHRDLFLDTLKGFAILLVVFGHVIQYGSGYDFYSSGSYFYNPIFKFIYSLHMPLFMLISGYLFYFSTKKYEAKDLFYSKVKSLLVPLLTLSLIPIFIIILKVFLGEMSFNLDTFLLMGKSIFEGYWFLWAILLCSICVFLNKKLFHDSWIVYLFLFFLCFITPDFINLAQCKFMYPYFIAGYFINKEDVLPKLINIANNKYIFLFVGIIFFFLLSFYDYSSYIYTSKIYVLGKDTLSMIGIDFYRWSIGFVGSFFIFSLFKLIDSNIKQENFIKGTLIYLGEHSKEIYIISSFIFEYIYSYIIFKFDFISFHYILILIQTMIIIFISLMIAFIIKKTNILKILILGMREGDSNARTNVSFKQ